MIGYFERLIKNREDIGIFNYTSENVEFVVDGRKYKIPSLNDNNIPGYLILEWTEVSELNRKTDFIKSGILSFSKEDQEKAYSALEIEEWKKILFFDTIKDILMFPTTEKVSRIVAIQKIQVINFVKNVMENLMENGYVIIPILIDIVERRQKELIKHKNNELISDWDCRSEININKEKSYEIKNQIADIAEATIAKQSKK